MSTSKIKIWIHAFRLRTLPLALSNAVMGSLLALSEDGFRWSIFALTVVTITLLQILSNLANDYGDAVSGKDTDERVGPLRVTASGLVTKEEIKRMIIVFVILSCISGTVLIFTGLNNLPWKELAIFFGLGLAAIAAAIKYTIGKNPYGYKGLADIFVFIFFGLIGVMGTYYLHTHWFDLFILAPASVIGLFSVGVLNINNLRDIETDAKSGKKTLAVRFGPKFARFYHLALISIGLIISVVYSIIKFYSGWQFLFLVTVPFFAMNIWVVFKSQKAEDLNNELRNLALTTFLFSLAFGLGLIL